MKLVCGLFDAQTIAVCAIVLSFGYTHAQEDELPLEQAPLGTPEVEGQQVAPTVEDVPQDNTGDSSTQEEADQYGYQLIRLYSRLQKLESEVAFLQGRIEELEHTLQEMTHQERRRYAELDRRLRELRGGGQLTTELLASAPEGSEQALYRDAFAYVNAKEFVKAVPIFEALISQYPNGVYVPDSMYWLGEINSTVEPVNLEKARQHFVQIINLYSNHVKIPEAMYKLGTIYHLLGDETRALDYLDRVVAEHPEHTAARLAESYADDLRR